MDIDLSELEKALSFKGRQHKEKVSPIKPGLSKQQLLDEAVKLASDVNHIYSRRLSTRVAGKSYYIDSGDLYQGGYRRQSEDVPLQVFEQLVANGKRLLKDYHEITEQVIQMNPGLALEANLEGKTGSKVLQFAYDRRINQIGALLNSRVSSPTVDLFLRFAKLVVKAPLGKEFEVYVDWWGGAPSLRGVSLYDKNKNGMARLAHFITYFEQVESGIKRQLDTIEIKKEVAK